MSRPQSTGRPGPLAAVFLALALCAPGAAGLFKVWVNQDAVQIGYALSSESARRRKLEELIEKLELELAAERTPGRLQRLGERLGLAPPLPEQMVGPRRDRDGT